MQRSRGRRCARVLPRWRLGRDGHHSRAGTYRVVLRPGTYVVRSPRKLVFGRLAPRTVRVVAGRFTVANFEIDTGIR